ncbi:MAG: AAA family ATPase, partial [bacterium]|nr:AAA family ATPase [bacterium]
MTLVKGIQNLTLKIAEARGRDVGRGIGRIDPEEFKTLNSEIGDVVEILGKKKTAIKLMPTFPEDRGKRIIQIDGIARENAGVALGEKVAIQKVPFQGAQIIVLSPLTSDFFREEDREYLTKLLDGLVVMEGNKIRATLFGSSFQEFLVEETDPDGPVLINCSTLIKIKGEAEKKEKIGITYEDIGGLKKEIGKIREMIELPLKYPEVFERLGISAPKGVLLHGTPGCGKTLIAKAVANETDAYFTSISGPEIMGKFYGESEGRLREIFEEAQANTPAILVIDEIDAIAPKREEMGGEKQVERRVVAQLLALMDGLESRGNLVVIGITNIPNTLDPALRRPGRFDRE